MARATVVLVDDGLATGSTMRAAVEAVSALAPAPVAVIVAVPTGARETVEEFERMPDVDAVVCVESPSPFLSVGGQYLDFTQTSDDEVRRLLEAAANG